jgi:hypothetical protein
MTEIQLDYPHCNRLRPRYLKHDRVEVLARQVRDQLVGSKALALPLDVLAGISEIRVNGMLVNVDIDTEHLVHDEAQKPVLGACEYDPSVPDTALVSVSPACEVGSTHLVLSTLAHELGHACFDTPGWIFDASQGPDLFDSEQQSSRIYRTTTQDPGHLSKPSEIEKEQQIAEYRANEFMGSLLVPRSQLCLAALQLAPALGINVGSGPSLHPDFPSGEILFAPPNRDSFDCLAMDSFNLGLAELFGVSSRFIEVRMQRYGLVR